MKPFRSAGLLLPVLLALLPLLPLLPAAGGSDGCSLRLLLVKLLLLSSTDARGLCKP
jgi:hypothetical protein